MKIPPSKSIMSPARAKEHVLSSSSSSSHALLSTSLSRKLKSNGSLKAQASPMFPPGSSSCRGSVNKRKGSGIGSPEPSSPKVTCIGQVRVKGKNQRSKINGGGEALADCGNRNVKWVHFPLKDFTCFIPCRSGFCMSNDKLGDGDVEVRSGGCCGAVLARWVVNDGAAKGRKIELVVGDEELEREEEIESRRTCRRNLFHEIEFTDVPPLSSDSARVSICIPPKNALLLMRCRSDPVKAAALANKYLEAPPPVEEDEEEIVDAVRRPMQEDKGETEAVEEDEDRGDCLIVGLERDEANTESPRKSIAAVLIKEQEEEGEGDCEASAPEQTLEEVPVPGIPNSKENEEQELPNCLLLMMCEPKLSMEVSKETWVCSTDFIRWVPGGRSRHSAKKTDAGEVPEKRKRVNPILSPTESTTINEEDTKPKVVLAKSHVINKGSQWKLQPQRASCHFPSQQREAAMIEKKIAGSHSFDPFVLTRCKSEPMRTASVV